MGGSSITCTWLVKCATVTRAITLASRFQSAAASVAAGTGSLVDDIDAQGADAGNLDLELVAGLHPERWLAAEPDAVRRSGGDDVARLQPGYGREIFDDGGDVEDHVIGRVVLHHVAVEPRRELERLRIGNDVGGDHPGAERPGGREVLAGGNRMLLGVAHADHQEARGAGDHL